MVAATLDAPIRKRFISGDFAPPSGYSPSIAPGSEVTAADILSRGVDEADWSFPAVLSTDRIDRQQDSVTPEGCDYADFARNCCVFFDHQSLPLPIGTMRSPQDGRLYLAIVPGKGIIGRVWIYRPGEDDKSAHAENCRHIWALVKAGLLNGLSLGFDPKGPVKSLRGGGNLYNEWFMLELSLVAIPANPDCLIIREPARLPSAIFKRLNPAIRKSLSAWYPRETIFHSEGELMTDTPAVKKHIRHEGDKWILYSHEGKVLGKHDTREEAVKQEQAVKANEHQAKSMSESSGAEGGYTAPEEHKAIYKGIVDRMNDHDAKGHSLHFNPESGELHHSYPDSESEEKVKSIAADLHDAPGVKSMTQEPGSGPSGDGYHKIYPQKDTDMQEESHTPSVHKSRQMSVIGKALFRAVRRREINGWIGKSLEFQARRIMPQLLKAKVEEKKAISIAWGIAGVRRFKSLLPFIVKAMDDDDDDNDADQEPDGDADDAALAADDAATDTAMDVPEEEAAGQPDGLELVQTAIENLEAAIPRLEPERREFWQGIIDQIKDHGEETYPDEDFGGENTEEAEGAAAGAKDDAKEQEITDEMLARYKSYRPVRVKRISVERIRKSFQKDPKVTDMIRKAANHLHGIGDLHGEFDDKKGHAILKGYTAAHHRACRTLARDLDRVHGAMTKDEKEPELKPATQPEETSKESHDTDEFGPVIKSLREQYEGMKGALATAAGIRLQG